MKRLRLIALTALVISIQIGSTSCRKIHGSKWVVYVNEKDQNQIVGFEVGPQPLRQWWQGAAREPKSEGKYIRNDGKEATAGPYWSEANVYVLKNPNDAVVKEARFSIQSDLSLQDESGVIWRRTNAPAELHHALVSRQ